MSYAIIRNANYKMNQIAMIERHNERLNHNYSNKDIDLSRSSENYHLKKILTSSYLNEFEKIREEHNLKGNLRLNGKKQSNVMCEFVITSDKEFFDKLGEDGTRQFFEDAYDFVKQKVGEEYVVSAEVHNDETVPHCHIVYIPTVYGKDRKGNSCKRINCSEFWKGKDSYSRLQDEYYKFITSRGYDLQRGEKGSTAEHLSVAEYKMKKTEEHLQEISEKAVETRKNLAKENEHSVALRQKSRREYAIVQKAKAETEKKKDDLAIEKRVLALNKSMFMQMLRIHSEDKKRLSEEMTKIKTEYLKFTEMKERFIEVAKAEIIKMKDENKRNAYTNQINANMSRFELTAEMEEYVSSITKKSKNKGIDFSL